MKENENGNNIITQDDLGTNSIFEDDSVVENVDTIQDPYPDTDFEGDEDVIDEDDDDMIDGEVEDDDSSNLHEYEDNDHPHESRPPTAADDYDGISDDDDTNPYEVQNPLQSTYPSSSSDR